MALNLAAREKVERKVGRYVGQGGVGGRGTGLEGLWRLDLQQEKR